MPSSFVPLKTLDDQMKESVSINAININKAKASILHNLDAEAESILSKQDAKFEDFKPLFDSLKNSHVLNIHRHPVLDRDLGIINTSSLQKAMSIVREKALLAFKREFDILSSENNFDAATRRANEAIQSSIFSAPRHNFFKTFRGLTSSQGKIQDAYEDMEMKADANPHSKRSIRMMPARGNETGGLVQISSAVSHTITIA